VIGVGPSRRAFMMIQCAAVADVSGAERVLYEFSGGRLNSSRTG
jgi:hypothetical protein